MAAAAAATAALTLHYEEFELVFKNYRKLGESVNWVAPSDTLNLGLKAPKNGTKQGIMEPWYMDMGKALKHLCISPDVDRRLYGFPPKMASTSQGPYWRPASQQFPRARQLGRQPGPHQGQHASGPGRDQQGRRAPHEVRVHEVHAPGPRSSTST